LFSDKDKLSKLEHIGYYRLKEFAEPFESMRENGLHYENISFSELLARYYQDKNLRVFLIHAIEKIEVSVKNQLAHILGQNYGAFGYLDFAQWSNRKQFTKNKILLTEKFIKTSLKKSLKRTSSRDAKNEENQNSDGFPNVWLAINLLSFGELVNIIKLLSKGNQKQLASKYDCSALEFISWMKSLHFIRNICSHNANIIDLQMKTKPKYKASWRLFVKLDDDIETDSSHRIAVIILILEHFIKQINPNYHWDNIRKSLLSIGRDDEKARMIGFKGREALKLAVKFTL